MPHSCDGYGGNFSIEHALNFRFGGLVVHRHKMLLVIWLHLFVVMLYMSLWYVSNLFLQMVPW